jgi:hypothetical protein
VTLCKIKSATPRFNFSESKMKSPDDIYSAKSQHIPTNDGGERSN